MAARNHPNVTYDRPSRSKATLFCPGCGHRSRFDGDWDVVETRGNSRYLCPACGVEITARATFDAEGPECGP